VRVFNSKELEQNYSISRISGSENWQQETQEIEKATLNSNFGDFSSNSDDRIINNSDEINWVHFFLLLALIVPFKLSYHRFLLDISSLFYICHVWSQC